MIKERPNHLFRTFFVLLTSFLPRAIYAQSDAVLLQQTLSQYQQERASLVTDIKRHADSIAQLRQMTNALSSQINRLTNNVSDDENTVAEADGKVSDKEDEITITKKPLDDAIADEQSVSAIEQEPFWHIANRGFNQDPEPNDAGISKKIQLVEARDATKADAIQKVCKQRCEKETSREFRVQCTVTLRSFRDCPELQRATEGIASKAVAHTQQVRKEVQPKLDKLNTELAALKNQAAAAHQELDDDRAALNHAQSQLSSTNTQINRLNGELPGLRGSLATVDWNIAHPPRDCSMPAFDYACAGAQLGQYKFPGCRTYCQPRHKGTCVAASCTDTTFIAPICGACAPY